MQLLVGFWTSEVACYRIVQQTKLSFLTLNVFKFFRVQDCIMLTVMALACQTTCSPLGLVQHMRMVYWTVDTSMTWVYKMLMTWVREPYTMLLTEMHTVVELWTVSIQGLIKPTFLRLFCIMQIGVSFIWRFFLSNCVDRGVSSCKLSRAYFSLWVINTSLYGNTSTLPVCTNKTMCDQSLHDK